MSRRAEHDGTLRGYREFHGLSKINADAQALAEEKRAQGLRARVTDTSGTGIQNGRYSHRVSWWFPVSK